MDIVGERVDPAGIRRLPGGFGQLLYRAKSLPGEHRSLSWRDGDQRLVGYGVGVLQGVESGQLRIVFAEQNPVIVRDSDEAGARRHGQHEQHSERNGQPPAAQNGVNVAVQQNRRHGIDHPGLLSANEPMFRWLGFIDTVTCR